VLALAAGQPGCHRAQADTPAEAAPGRVGPEWAKQPRYAFAVTLDSKASLPSGNAAFDLALQASLELRVLSQVPDGVRVLGKLTQPAMTLGGQADAEAKKISEELEDPVVFVLAGGRVTDSWFASRLSGVSVSTWRTIFVALQLSEPKPAAAKWAAEEFDSAGRYRAAYQREPTTGAVVRTKGSYVGLLDTQGGKAPPAEMLPQIQSAETRFTLVDGLLQRSASNETVVMKFQANSTLTITNRVVLEQRPVANDPSLKPFDEAKFITRANHAAPDHPAPSPRESAEASFDGLRTEGKTFQGVVALLEERAREKQSAKKAKEQSTQDKDAAPSEEHATAFSALVAFLRSQPQTIELAMARLRAQSPAADLIVSALGAARTPAAQAALLAIIGDPKMPLALRNGALIDVGRNARPEREVAPAILAVLSEPGLAAQARMSLGSLSRRLREAGRIEEADALRPVFTAQLAAAKSPTVRADVLRAISNSGDPTLFPIVVPFFDERATGDERAAAAEALRHMQLSEVDPLLAKQLTAESDAHVALAIIGAMRTRGASAVLVPALIAVMASGTTPNVRQRAVELAVRWARDYPELRAALQEAAQKDPDPHVRSAASKSI